MKLNPRTEVWEYTATLDATLFNDGPIEVRAIAWPVTGEPRVLAGEDLSADNGEHSMVLNPNAGGSLQSPVRYVSTSGSNTNDGLTPQTPMQGIKHAALDISSQHGNADHGTIYLLEGDYRFATPFSGFQHPVTETGWLTVRAAPGLARDEVKITIGGPSERLNTSLIRLSNLTIEDGLVSSGNLNQSARLWIDNSLGTKNNRFADLTFNGFSTYSTDSTFRRVRKGFVRGLLIRNIRIEQTGEDGFFNPFFIVNATLNDINREGWEQYSAILQGPPHPDVVQWFGGSVFENRIIYGLQSSNVVGSQGIFLRGTAAVSDVALVNVAVQSDNNQWWGPTDHLLIWQSTFTHNFLFRDAALFNTGNVRNVSFRNSVFDNLEGLDNNPQYAQIDNNHFIRNTAWGTNATQGDPLWVNPLEFNFRPASNSPLIGRVVRPLVPVDANGILLPDPGSIGPLQQNFGNE